MHIMKLDSSSLRPTWNFFYYHASIKPMARFIWPNPMDDGQLFYAGYKQNWAFVQKLQRRDGKILFEDQFQVSAVPTLTDI